MNPAARHTHARKESGFIEGARKLASIVWVNLTPAMDSYEPDTAVQHATTTFLDRLAGDLLRQFPKSWSDVCVVFPTRRAGLYFRKVLASKLSQPAWAPAIFSI